MDVNFDLIAYKGDQENLLLEIFAAADAGLSDNHVPRECSTRWDLPHLSADAELPADVDQEQFSIPIGPLRRVLRKIQSGYNTTPPYHNFLHGIDVSQASLCAIRDPEHFGRLDRFCLLFSAICHDVGHPGRTSDFLAKTNNPLVGEFGSESTLERFHLDFAKKILMEDAVDSSDGGVLGGMSDAQRLYFFTVLQEAIWATDMAKHGEILESFTQRASEGKFSSPREMALDDKLLLMKVALKCADISNVCRCRPCAVFWTKKVSEEFLEQGDDERQRGLPVTPMCDRIKFKSDAHLVTGFINFVAGKFFVTVAETLPSIKPFVRNLESNKAAWQQEIEKAATATTPPPSSKMTSWSVPLVVLAAVAVSCALKWAPEWKKAAGF